MAGAATFAFPMAGAGLRQTRPRGGLESGINRGRCVARDISVIADRETVERQQRYGLLKPEAGDDDLVATDSGNGLAEFRCCPRFGFGKKRKAGSGQVGKSLSQTIGFGLTRKAAD